VAALATKGKSGRRLLKEAPSLSPPRLHEMAPIDRTAHRLPASARIDIAPWPATGVDRAPPGSGVELLTRHKLGGFLEGRRDPERRRGQLVE
jgi:hypothetical protein